MRDTYRAVGYSDRPVQRDVHGNAVFELKRYRTLFGGFNQISPVTVFQFLQQNAIRTHSGRYMDGWRRQTGPHWSGGVPGDFPQRTASGPAAVAFDFTT